MNRRAKSNDAYTGVFISYVTCIYVLPHVRERESAMPARQIIVNNINVLLFIIRIEHTITRALAVSVAKQTVCQRRPATA